MPQSIPLGEAGSDPALVEQACEWLSLFYPDIAPVRSHDWLQLQSGMRSDEELALLWRCALANAELFAAAQTKRERVLAELLQ